jgi:hypothetical protein
MATEMIRRQPARATLTREIVRQRPIAATLTTEMVITRQQEDGSDYVETVIAEQDFDEQMRPVGPVREVPNA